jgi:DNA (cytosine-5)-methyltransferase 1
VIVDLFAGPGGWSEGLRMLDPDLYKTEIGLEWDAAACETRAAAGHATIQADVSQFPVEQFVGRTTGLIASPPCQDFSVAGLQAGVDGERGRLITEVVRWGEALRPEWIVCEQVTPALPLWKDYALHFSTLGYSTWCGNLNAADYGVPQTRKRAILIASRKHTVTVPPPTHCEPKKNDGTMNNWVTIEQATGYSGVVNSGCAHYGKGRDFAIKMNAWERPSITVTTKVGSQWHLYLDSGDHRLLSTEEVLALQSFRKDYPVAGNKGQIFSQVGNAIPPLLAFHVLKMAVSGG